MKLRIGLLLHALELEAWQHAMLCKIVASDYAEVTIAVVLPQASRTSGERRHKAHGHALPRLVQAAYERWENRYPCVPDACAKEDATALLATVPVVRACPADGPSGNCFARDDLRVVEQAALDVWLDLSGSDAGRALADAAKFGIWALTFGDERKGFGAPPGFWELLHECPISALSVSTRGSSQAGDRVILRAFSATDFASARRNNNGRYWKAAALLPHTLRALASDAIAPAIRAVQPNEAGSGPGQKAQGLPGTWQVARYLLRRIKHAGRSRAQELLTLSQWILLFRFGSGLVPPLGEFREIVPPRDRFWADPHVIQRGGRYYIFLEEYLFEARKGHISVLVMDESGRYAQPVTVLERDYHLSYPHIFEAQGELYMIPESADNRTVELYRCIEFPRRWGFVKNLMEDITAFDATVLQHGDRWWLFANVVEHEGASSWDELFLFHSESLSGEWTPHRCNPIVSDVRAARPAGAIVRDGAALWRPSQDCSVRYGYAVNMNRIRKLSVSEYEEEKGARIAPPSGDAVQGVHTYARAGRLTVLDALRPRSRFGRRGPGRMFPADLPQ